MNKAEIIEQYNKLLEPLRGDNITNQQYEKLGIILREQEKELLARKGELDAQATLSLEEENELTELQIMFAPPSPTRDLAAEIDDLKAKVEKLEKSSKR